MIFSAIALIPIPAISAAPALRTFLLRVNVLDDNSRAPIADAHVSVIGNLYRQDGFTGPSGVLRFRLVPDRYHVLVVAAGYSFVDTHVVTATRGGRLALIELGHRTSPRVIAVVTARAKGGRHDGRRITRHSPGAVIAGDVASGLRLLPAIGVGARGNLTINGNGGQTVASTVDGASIFPSSLSGGTLENLTADLFSSASIGASTAGAPSGTLDFQTYAPTIDWIGRVRDGASSYSGESGQVVERGTSGTFGFSFTHAEAQSATENDGMFYADRSGTAYQHDTLLRSSGDTFTVRHGFSPNNALFLSLGSIAFRDPYGCTLEEGTLPCGYGPNNTIDNRTNYLQLRDQGEISQGAFSLQIFSSRDNMNFNFGNIATLGHNIGYLAEEQTKRIGITAKANLQFPHLGSSSIAYTLLGQQATTSNNQQGVEYGLPLPSLTQSDFSLTQSLFSVRRFSGSMLFGVARADGSQSAILGLHATYTPTNYDRLTLDLRSGDLGVPMEGVSGVAAPTQLFFNCNGGAIGGGPTQTGASPRTSHAQLTWFHDAAKISWNADAYLALDRGVEVAGYTPASELPATLFTPNYFTDANGISGSICGTPQSITMSTALFQFFAPAQSLVNSGVDAAVTLAPTRKVRATIAYGLAKSVPYGLNVPYFTNSTILAGRQLPQVPFQHGSLQIADRLRHGATLLGVLNYFGSQNYYRAQPLLIADVGLRLNTRRGYFVLGMQNIGNAGAPFATGFSSFPYVQHLMPGRTLSARYVLPLGRAIINHTSIASPSGPGFGFMASSFTPGTPSHWLSVNRASPMCGPEMLPVVRRDLAIVRSYDVALHRAIASGRNPAAVRAPALPGFELRYVSSPTGPEIMLDYVPGKDMLEAPLYQCTYIHSDNVINAQRLHIYIPGYTARRMHKGALYYSDLVGFYLPPAIVNGTASRRDVSIIAPATPPLHPFTIVPRLCPVTYRSAVLRALKEIGGYIARYQAEPPTEPLLTSVLRVAGHPSDTGTWFEISDFGATGLMKAVGRCVNAAYLSKAVIAKHGVSAAPMPSLNYARRLGFYWLFSP